MKTSYYTLLACAAGAAALALAKIWWEPLEPPGRLVQEMTQPVGPAPQAPPAGAVPHCSSPALRRTSPEAPELFARHCAACHGAAGTGKSYVAAQPGMPEVNDLTASNVTPDELLRTLTEGRGAMPAHGDRLSEEARRALIQYIINTLQIP